MIATNMLTPRTLALVACAALLTSCKVFDETAVQDITDPSDAATTRVKFHNFAPSSVGVNFYANDKKVSAISSTRCSPTPAAADVQACNTTGIELATGTTYSNAAASGLYLSLDPGTTTLAAKVAGTATVVSTLSQSLDAGKFYTFVMSGIYNTTAQTAEAFVVEDPIPTLDYAVASVRLVNAVSNGTGPLNLIATNTTTTTATSVGAAVAYKGAGTFVSLAPGIYDFVVRYTGSSTNVISRTGLTLEPGRVYTITARGSTATASTLGLDFTSNQR